MKHMRKAVFYDQAHTDPPVFTIRHMRFMVKHMPLQVPVCVPAFVETVTCKRAANRLCESVVKASQRFPVAEPTLAQVC